MRPEPEILDVIRGHRGIGDSVVDDGVHRHRHRVSRKDLFSYVLKETRVY